MLKVSCIFLSTSHFFKSLQKIMRKERNNKSNSVCLKPLSLHQPLTRSKTLPSLHAWEALDDIIGDISPLNTLTFPGTVDSSIFHKHPDSLMSDCMVLSKEEIVQVKKEEDFLRRGYLLRSGEKMWGVLTNTVLKLYLRKMVCRLWVFLGNVGGRIVNRKK
jgi:hypothetical protein